MNVKRYAYLLSLVFAVVLAASQVVQAQCGASLSSCKTCHEVKRQKPVATQGEWHQQHAFGDFCEFCHGGNTASNDKDAAHQGINTMPVKDAGNTCSSCHPDDYKERAQKYAAILKVDLGDLSSGGGAATAEESAAPESKENVAPSASATIAAPTGEVVDFNELLSETEESRINYGDVILVLVILGGAAIFLLMYWLFNKETLVAKIKSIASLPPEDAGEATSDQSEIEKAIKERPMLGELAVKLKDLDPEALQALGKLAAQKEAGETILKTLAKVDLEILTGCKKLDEKELDIVLALAKKL